MYSIICRTVDSSDRQIAKFITVWFSGQLKGWWDHYLGPLQKT